MPYHNQPITPFTANSQSRVEVILFEQAKDFLRVDYSQEEYEDRNGKLLYRFRIPTLRLAKLGALPNLEYGYLEEGASKVCEFEWKNFPAHVARDALEWLRIQRAAAQLAHKTELLRRIDEHIEALEPITG